MSCSKCGLVGHNSRKCPDKDTVNVNPPPPKRGRGRPRKNVPVDTPDQTNVQHEISAQPSQLGRGNRSVRGGQGSRGRGREPARGAARGVRGVRSEGQSCTTVSTTSDAVDTPSQLMLVCSTQGSTSSAPKK